jgi:hypothetical protein
MMTRAGRIRRTGMMTCFGFALPSLVLSCPVLSFLSCHFGLAFICPLFVLSLFVLHCLYLSLFVFICLVLSCLVFICLVLSCLYLSCLIFIYLVLSCLDFFCLALSLFIFICLALPLFVLIRLNLSCLVLSCLVSFCFGLALFPVYGRIEDFLHLEWQRATVPKAALPSGKKRPPYTALNTNVGMPMFAPCRSWTVPRGTRRSGW